MISIVIDYRINASTYVFVQYSTHKEIDKVPKQESKEALRDTAPTNKISCLWLLFASVVLFQDIVGCVYSRHKILCVEY